MASVRKRGDRYTGLYRDENGNQRSAGSYDDPEEALARATVLELDARPPETAEAAPAARNGKPTIARFGPLAIAGAKLEETSRETYTFLLKHVVAEFGAKTLDEPTPAEVRAFARKLDASDMSSSTASHVFGVLKLIYATAVQDYPELKDPTTGISVQRKGYKEKVIVTPEEARAIEEAILPHYRLLAETMFATGMRYGELMALKATDIVRTRGGKYVIKVRRSIAEVKGQPVERKYGKTAHAMRDVPVSTALALRLIAVARPDGRVFVNTHGNYIRRSNFFRIWKRACEKTGLAGVTPHSARHSVASWLANDPKVPLASVRDMLGHSSLEQTNGYVHYIDDDDDPRLAALDRLAA